MSGAHGSVIVMCPVCDGQRFEDASVAGLALRLCVACGVRIAEFSRPRRIGYAHVDMAAYQRSIAVARRSQSATIVSLVRKHVPSGQWLDVGCGHGYVLEAANAEGFDARGIEPNALAANAGRQRGLHVSDGFLDASIEAADVVSVLDVLEHLEDMHVFADLARAKCRRLLVVKVPSSDGLFYRLAHAFRLRSLVERLWQANYDDPHRVYFNEGALHRFLESHRFEIVSTHYLAEVEAGTVVDRLTLDGAIPTWKARLAVPVVWCINAFERIRGRSDALLVLARPRREP
jgi:SAM-dependent methyltransferase